MASIVGKPASLMTSGALVAVKLCVPECVKSDVPPISTLAEINTGSIVTIIQEGVATSLGLEPVAKLELPMLTRPKHIGILYRIRLQFPEGSWVETAAMEMPYMVREHARIKCIIGRDILRRGVFVYNGLENTFSINF
jgi:hypothetical protein